MLFISAERGFLRDGCARWLGRRRQRKFLPQKIPQLSLATIHSWSSLTYPKLASVLLRHFVSEEEIIEEDWNALFSTCFSDFLDPVIDYTPIDDSITVVDLSRGPSLAFKDLGMQCLTAVMDFFLKRRKAKLTLLVGTSGDTGPSAMIALKNKPSMNIIVLYPAHGVSAPQEAQMLAYDLRLPSAKCFGVEGNSDELDEVIESVFLDNSLRNKFHLGTVNSVNVLRLLAQVVHFFHLYLRAKSLNSSIEHVHVSIPSGAAGHLTASVIAKLMGLPLKNILVGTTVENDILYGMLERGLIQRKTVAPTLASAMDISVPYNIERLLFLASQKDKELTKSAMLHLREGIDFQLPENIQAWFSSHGLLPFRVSKEEILETIKFTHINGGTVQDPHTSVGIKAAQLWHSQQHFEVGIVYCMGCACPLKFIDTIELALGREEAAAAIDSIVSTNMHAKNLHENMSNIGRLRATKRLNFEKHGQRSWQERLVSEIEHI